MKTNLDTLLRSIKECDQHTETKHVNKLARELYAACLDKLNIEQQTVATDKELLDALFHLIGLEKLSLSIRKEILDHLFDLNNPSFPHFTLTQEDLQTFRKTKKKNLPHFFREKKTAYLHSYFANCHDQNTRYWFMHHVIEHAITQGDPGLFDILFKDQEAPILTNTALISGLQRDKRPPERREKNALQGPRTTTSLRIRKCFFSDIDNNSSSVSINDTSTSVADPLSISRSQQIGVTLNNYQRLKRHIAEKITPLEETSNKLAELKKQITTLRKKLKPSKRNAQSNHPEEGAERLIEELTTLWLNKRELLKKNPDPNNQIKIAKAFDNLLDSPERLVQNPTVIENHPPQLVEGTSVHGDSQAIFTEPLDNPPIALPSPDTSNTEVWTKIGNTKQGKPFLRSKLEKFLSNPQIDLLTCVEYLRNRSDFLSDADFYRLAKKGYKSFIFNLFLSDNTSAEEKKSFLKEIFTLKEDGTPSAFYQFFSTKRYSLGSEVKTSHQTAHLKKIYDVLCEEPEFVLNELIVNNQNPKTLLPLFRDSKVKKAVREYIFSLKDPALKETYMRAALTPGTHLHDYMALPNNNNTWNRLLNQDANKLPYQRDTHSINQFLDEAKKYPLLVISVLNDLGDEHAEWKKHLFNQVHTAVSRKLRNEPNTLELFLVHQPQTKPNKTPHFFQAPPAQENDEDNAPRP